LPPSLWTGGFHTDTRHALPRAHTHATLYHLHHTIFYGGYTTRTHAHAFAHSFERADVFLPPPLPTTPTGLSCRHGNNEILRTFTWRIPLPRIYTPPVCSYHHAHSVRATSVAPHLALPETTSGQTFLNHGTCPSQPHRLLLLGSNRWEHYYAALCRAKKPWLRDRTAAFARYQVALRDTLPCLGTWLVCPHFHTLRILPTFLPPPPWTVPGAYPAPTTPPTPAPRCATPMPTTMMFAGVTVGPQQVALHVPFWEKE